MRTHTYTHACVEQVIPTESKHAMTSNLKIQRAMLDSMNYA